jgi:hypothetical protein
MSPASTVLASEVVNELPADPIVFGVSALVILGILLWITTRFDPDR